MPMPDATQRMLSAALDEYRGAILWRTPEGRIGVHPGLVKYLCDALDISYLFLSPTPYDKSRWRGRQARQARRGGLRQRGRVPRVNNKGFAVR